MRFFVHKRRPTPSVIIVALVDVLIVLLIFLIVTTTFKQHPALRLALPESTQAVTTGAEPDAPLIVTVDAEGALRLGASGVPVTADRLRAEFTVRAEANPQLKLTINADEKAPFGQIVKVMDAAKEAKIKSVNALTRQTAR
jgi:biopolymer transport protein ExbD